MPQAAPPRDNFCKSQIPIFVIERARGHRCTSASSLTEKFFFLQGIVLAMKLSDLLMQLLRKTETNCNSYLLKVAVKASLTWIAIKLKQDVNDLSARLQSAR